MKAVPNKKMPVENAPIKKYFNDASLEAKLSFFEPAKTYNGIDNTSIPKNSITMCW